MAVSEEVIFGAEVGGESWKERKGVEIIEIDHVAK